MRIAIFTETFLPKIDGVVSVLCLALQHLRNKGHEVLLFGPPDMPDTYAGHRLVRTGGPRFWLYPELRINLPSGKIVRELRAFQPMSSTRRSSDLPALRWRNGSISRLSLRRTWISPVTRPIMWGRGVCLLPGGSSVPVTTLPI